MQYIRGGSGEISALREEKAKKLGIRYRDWHDLEIKKGDWIVTDDGWVLRVKNIYDVENKRGKRNKIYYTSRIHYSTSHQGMRGYKLYGEGLRRTNMGNSVGVRSARTATEEERAVVDLIIKGGLGTIEAYHRIFPVTSKPWLGVRKLLRRRRVIKYMIEQLQDKLKEHGLTEDWVLDRLKEEGEDKKSRANVRLDVIKFVAELNNMVSSKKYSDEITERVYLSEGVVKELEAKRKLTSYEGGKEERISSINGE